MCFAADPVPGGENGKRQAVPVQAVQLPGTGLRHGVERTAVLPLPADGGLRGLRLGLDHRAEAVRGQLLFRRVSAGVPAEVPAHPSRADDQQVGPVPGHRAMLRAPQDVGHHDVVLRPRGQHYIRHVAGHGGGPLRMQLSRCSSRHYIILYYIILHTRLHTPTIIFPPL